MSKTSKPTDTASAIAALDALLRSVEAGWIPAARKINAARRALDTLRAFDSHGEASADQR